jgi:glycerol-3-phosphate acyltransferase PlsY
MGIDVPAIMLVAYFVGSIPAPYLIARVVAGVDLREAGEGNVGARNVFHVVSAFWGIVTFAADFAKGALVAVLFVSRPTPEFLLAGVAVLVGHAFPIWLGFVGGKGLSTVGGFAAIVMPWAAAVGGAGAAVAWGFSRRFMPTTAVAIVIAILAAPLTGVAWSVMVTVVLLFALTGLKRVLDESRMRRVEAVTGWDRSRGLQQ